MMIMSIHHAFIYIYFSVLVVHSKSQEVAECFKHQHHDCLPDESLCSSVKSAIHDGFINKRDYLGKTLTFKAAESGQLDSLRLLLECEANVNLTDINGSSPLHAAVKNGHFEAIKHLAHHLIDLNLKDDYGETALHLAVVLQNFQCVKVLLMHGADPNIRGPNNVSLVHIAATLNKYNKSAEIIKELLKYQGSIDALDTRGKPPLWYAIKQGNIASVKELIKAGAIASQDMIWESVDKGHLDLVKQLVRSSDDANSRGGWSNSTVLVRAVTHDHSDIAEFLLDKGAKIDATFGNGLTALHRAISAGSLKCIKLLLDRECNVNTKDNNGRSPLDYSYSNLYVHDLLKRKGAKRGYMIRNVVSTYRRDSDEVEN